MNEPEKPLHVRVAEALGWTECEQGWVFGRLEWCGTNPARENGWDGHGRMQIPRYDLDWHSTGPLIERFRFGLFDFSEPADGDMAAQPLWIAYRWEKGEYADWTEHHPQDNRPGDGYLTLDGSAHEANEGPTPLIAVCNLILALHAAGKLPK